jgi:LPXTG-motif cell wall-anchored protein
VKRIVAGGFLAGIIALGSGGPAFGYPPADTTTTAAPTTTVAATTTTAAPTTTVAATTTTAAATTTVAPTTTLLGGGAATTLPGGQLPQTGGSSTASNVAIASILVAAGVGMYAISRARRHQLAG